MKIAGSYRLNTYFLLAGIAFASIGCGTSEEDDASDILFEVSRNVSDD
jgi:hypothetical protein